MSRFLLLLLHPRQISYGRCTQIRSSVRNQNPIPRQLSGSETNLYRDCCATAFYKLYLPGQITNHLATLCRDRTNTHLNLCHDSKNTRHTWFATGTNLWLKQQDVAGWLRQVTQPPHIAGPLGAISSHNKQNTLIKNNKMQKLRLYILLLATAISVSSYGQKNPIVVVDGFFIKQGKTEALEFLGKDIIRDTITITPDSAIKIIDKYGSNGIFIINTTDSRGEKSLKLRRDLYFEDPPIFYINDQESSIQDLKKISPKQIDSIHIITPLSSARKNGLKFIGGFIEIETFDNPHKITIDKLSNSQFSNDTSFTYIDNYVKVPTFEIEIKLSDEAEKILKDSHETIIVQAYFRGTPKDKNDKDYNDWGYVVVSEFPIELFSNRIACFSNVKIPKKVMDELENNNIEVLINVFSGRRASLGNILDVNILQKPINEIKGKKYTLRGKLIGE